MPKESSNLPLPSSFIPSVPKLRVVLGSSEKSLIGIEPTAIASAIVTILKEFLEEGFRNDGAKTRALALAVVFTTISIRGATPPPFAAA